jgi:LacI family transcriptional regulator
MKALTSSVTMQTVAETSGVSLATVSRVYNGSPSVTAATRKLVLDTAKKLNFHPNSTARTLAAKKSYLIAVVLPDLLNPYFTELLNDLENLCGDSRYTMILYNSNGDAEKEKKIVQEMISRQVDGMLITMTMVNTNTLELLKSVPFPVVIMTRTFNNFDSVGIRHTEGGKLAAEHLLSQKAEEFIYFGLEDDEKFFGFQEYLLDCGVAKEKISVIGNQNWYFNTVSSGARVLSNFIRNRTSSRKTGLFCVNDLYASFALEAAHEANIKVPEEMSIVGFDNTMLCEMVYPKLTSIYQPIEEIARTSFQLLEDRMVDGYASKSTEVQNIILTPRIIVRGT